MRYSTLLLFLCLFLNVSFCFECKKQPLKINLNYSTKEKSKDSRMQRETFDLENGLLKYTYADNRFVNEKKVKEISLSKAQHNSIVKIIKSGNLLRKLDILEKKEFDIPYTAVLVECKIEYGAKRGDLNLISLVSETNNNQDFLAIEKLRTALSNIIK